MGTCRNTYCEPELGSLVELLVGSLKNLIDYRPVTIGGLFV
jgi:hypothetical protein